MNCSFWLTAFVKHAIIKKKRKKKVICVYLCFWCEALNYTAVGPWPFESCKKKKLACWVFKFELPLNPLDKLHSQTRWAWLQLHAHQIHWHQSSYWQIPFRSLKEKDTELCDTDCNLTALLPVICKYVYCQTVKPGSGGVKMPSLRCLFLAFQNTCWLSQWK